MAKFVEFNQIGGAEVLNVVDRDIPKPGPGELVVRIKACGLNQAELLYFQGQYIFQPQFPSKLGLEGSGVVHAVGNETNNIKVGDEVCLTPNIMPYDYGYLGEYAVVPEEAIVNKPSNISFEEGAAFWMTYATSYAGLVMRGGLKKGADQTVLITAASSGVGIAAIQLAKYFGAKVIATTRTSGKKNFLIDQGADWVIATDEDDLISEVRRYSGDKGFHIAFDPIGGSILNDIAEAAANEASIIVYGALSREFDASMPLLPLLVKGLNISGFHLVFHMLQHSDRFEGAKKHLLEGLNTGVYKPVIDKKFELTQVRDAYEYMLSNQQQGKVLITC